MKDKYIKLNDVLDALIKLRDVRLKRINCSKSASLEYNAFNYVINVVKKVKVYEF